MCRTKRPLLLIGSAIGVLALGGPSLAEEPQFEQHEFKSADGLALPYRLVRPEPGDDPEKAPVLIFLHGAGERGTDNCRQLVWGKDFLAAAARVHGAFVIVPQCPPNERWAEVDWSADEHRMPEKPSRPLAAVVELLDRLCGELALDKSRIYIAGLSMGGYGTWDAVQRMPKKFAAAVPICGGGDEQLAGRIKDVPIWGFHGEQDPVVKPIRSRRMVGAIKDAGGNPKYTEYPGVGHHAWQNAFAEEALLPWIFAKSLDD